MPFLRWSSAAPAVAEGSSGQADGGDGGKSGAAHRGAQGVAEAAIGAVRLGTEAVQGRQRTTWGDFENRASVVGSAYSGCPVEVPVGTLDEDGGRASI